MYFALCGREVDERRKGEGRHLVACELRKRTKAVDELHLHLHCWFGKLHHAAELC